MPLNITPGDKPIDVDHVNLLIYAPPGNGKTSLGFSAADPLLLDFDKGAHRSGFRRDAVIVEHWNEVANLSDEDLKPYKTIVVDTVGRALDMLTVSLQEENPKLRTRHGGLTLQGYGELKAAFKGWVDRMQLLGKDVVMIAHDKEDKRGDETVLRADVQGGSYSEIFKLADGVAYLNVGSEGQRFLDFRPSDTHSGKNPAQFDLMKVPDLNQDPDYLASVIEKTKKSVGQIGKESKAVADEVNKFRKKVNKVEDAEGMNSLLKKVKKIETRAVQVQVKRLMKARNEQIGVVFDEGEGKFVDAPKADKEPAAVGDALTWDDLANLYDERNGGGRKARTLPMEKVAEWAETQPDIVLMDNETYHLVKQKAA